MLEHQLRFVADTEQSQTITLDKLVEDKRIYLYYKLPKYYQNVRTYVQGVDYDELAQPEEIRFSDVNCEDKDNEKRLKCSVNYQACPRYSISVQK